MGSSDRAEGSRASGEQESTDAVALDLSRSHREALNTSSQEIKASQAPPSRSASLSPGAPCTSYFLCSVGALLCAAILCVLVARYRLLWVPPIELEMIPADLHDEALLASLVGSEEQYMFNVRRMRELRQAKFSTLEDVTKADLVSNFLVPTYPCGLQGRFGLWGEGGKWICLRHYRHTSGSPPRVISIGSRGDTSFEEAVHERLNASSDTFDFSLDYSQQKHVHQHSDFIKFYKAGLAGSSQLDEYAQFFPKAPFVTIGEMMRMVGFAHVDIFKIDCEGCEHAVVQDMTRWYSKDTVPFGQMQMEIHYISHAAQHMKLLEGLESLGYRLFHAEINGWWSEGYEIALIHERLVKPRVVVDESQQDAKVH